MEIAKTARLNVEGTLWLNKAHPTSPYKGECLIRLLDGAVWDARGVFYAYRGSTVVLKKGAHLTTGDGVTCNAGTFIECEKKITIGSYVSMARLVFVFDSDFHPIYDSENKRINEACEVVIEDRVWIGVKSTVLKGVRIGTGSVVGANSVVTGKTAVPPRTVSVSPVSARPVKEEIFWER